RDLPVLVRQGGGEGLGGEGGGERRLRLPGRGARERADGPRLGDAERLHGGRDGRNDGGDEESDPLRPDRGEMGRRGRQRHRLRAPARLHGDRDLRAAARRRRDAVTRTLAVIPARYGATRFPGKPLARLWGKPMLQHVWERAREAGGLDRLVIAT